MSNTGLTAIILINWNQEEDVSECLESLKKLRYKNHKIILVDNNSTDGSYKILTEKFQDVKFVRNTENLGYAGGMNAGVEEALKDDPEFILVMNSDTVVSAQLLDRLVTILESDKQTAIAGPVILDYYGRNKIQFAGARINLRLAKIKHLTKLDTTNKTISTDYMSGCCFLIRTEIVKEYGLFDNDFFILCEDLDLSLRLRDRGYRIVCDSRAIIWHKESTKISSSLTHYFWFRNIFLILNRYLSKPHYYFACCKIILGNCLKNILLSILQGNFRNVRIIIMGVTDYFKKRMGKGRMDTVARIIRMDDDNLKRD